MNVSKIIAELTLEEKCRLCAQEAGSFGRVTRLGLPGNIPQDNPRGGADYFRTGLPKEGDGEYHPVAFPSDAALGASWDTELAEKTGRFFAMECLSNPDPVTWLFRPGANIKRSPLCGRNFEYFSEDPQLSGEMAGSYIIGLQENGVAATLKHYVCNNQEFERMTTNAVVSERAFREIYARSFEIAIKKGRPLSIMSSYNKVNGEWVNSNSHVMDVLRKEIGFDGVVVSDFAAIHHNKIEGHKNGMDIELAPVECHWSELHEAVLSGRIEEARLDKELTRVFTLCEKMYASEPMSADMDELHAEAEKAACQCTVLLKNDGILPLAKDTEDLLVLGNLSIMPAYMGGGSGHMNGYRIDVPLDKIRVHAPKAAYSEGYPKIIDFEDPVNRDPALLKEALAAAEKANTLLVYAGLDYPIESEGYDRPDMLLPRGQRDLLDALVTLDKKIILVVAGGSVIDLSAWADRLSAIIYAPLSGEAFGSSVADILFGEAEPGGRLAETWPVCLEHTPAYTNFTSCLEDHEDVVYGEDIYAGYRWYEKRKLPVLFPFGFGLSYTTFEITDCQVDKDVISPEDRLTVSCRIRNTGSRTGSQVIQVYVSDRESTTARPVRELKGFAKVSLAPGEEKTVSVILDAEAFRYWQPRRNCWILEDGIFDICVQTDAQTVIASLPVMLQGGDLPFVYTEMTALVWFLKNPRFREILQQMNKSTPLEFFYNNNWNVLCYPLPFYRFTEPLLGESYFTMEEIHLILAQMNRR